MPSDEFTEKMNNWLLQEFLKDDDNIQMLKEIEDSRPFIIETIPDSEEW